LNVSVVESQTIVVVTLLIVVMVLATFVVQMKRENEGGDGKDCRDDAQ